MKKLYSLLFALAFVAGANAGVLYSYMVTETIAKDTETTATGGTITFGADKFENPEGAPQLGYKLDGNPGETNTKYVKCDLNTALQAGDTIVVYGFCGSNPKAGEGYTVSLDRAGASVIGTVLTTKKNEVEPLKVVATSACANATTFWISRITQSVHFTGVEVIRPAAESAFDYEFNTTIGFLNNPTDWNENYQFQGANEEYKVFCNLPDNGSLVGPYELGENPEVYFVNSDYYQYYADSAYVVVTAIAGGYHCDVEIYGTDYDDDFNEVPFTAHVGIDVVNPTAPIEFTAYLAEVDNWGETSINANANGYGLSLSIEQAAITPGTYAAEDFMGSINESFFYNQWAITAGSITLAENDGVYTITGLVTCDNGWQFNLNVTTALPAADATIAFTSTNAQYQAMFRAEGAYDIVATETIEGVAYTVGFHVANVSDFAGAFSLANYDLGNCYLKVGTDSLEIIAAEIEVAEDGDNYVTTGWALASGASVYMINLNLTGAVVEEPAYAIDATTPFTAAFAECTLTPSWFANMLEATNEDGQSIYLEINAMLNDDDELEEGTYVVGEYEAILPGKASYNPMWEEWMTDGSYAADADENKWFIVSGEATVAYVNDEFTLTFTGLNSAKQAVTFTIGTTTATALDELDAEKTVKFFQNGQFLIKKGNNTYNVLGVKF